MSDNNYDLDENENSESMPENTTIDVKPSLGDRLSNFFSKLTQKRLGPGDNKIQYTNKSFSSWERSQAISDFFSTVGETAQRVFSPLTGAISNIANRIKESAENKKYNDPSKSGINVSTIETQNQKPIDVIMPRTASNHLQDTVVNAKDQTTPIVEPKGIIDNAKSAKDISLEAESNGLTIEEIKIDETRVTKDKQEEVVQPAPLANQISTGKINVGQPNKDEKTTDDFEK